jgi:hypothetical protein
LIANKAAHSSRKNIAVPIFAQRLVRISKRFPATGAASKKVRVQPQGTKAQPRRAARQPIILELL